MKSFRYVADPLCLLAMALYAVNRWLVKPLISGGFMHDHFNDVLLIPAALPLILWVQRRFAWRQGDRMPNAFEIVQHGFVWALICEGIGPFLLHKGTADLRDVLAYTVGGVVAWVWWNRSELISRKTAAG